MPQPQFELASIGDNCYVVNDRGRTVAIVTSQGYIDWLLVSPLQDGQLLTSIRKETHLSYTLGLKLLLTCPQVSPSGRGTDLTGLSHRVEADGARLVLVGDSKSDDGLFTVRTEATLSTDERHSRYQWRVHHVLTYRGTTPVYIGGMEFNNVYPGKVGRCMLFAPDKEYSDTLMVDSAGTVWRFPHQHIMHYSRKINELKFAVGTMGGFFTSSAGSPVVIVEESTGTPTWAICDMYYDLHCQALFERQLQPGEQLVYSFVTKYLNRAESDAYLGLARPIPVTETDFKEHDRPRFELGLNTFESPVAIDACDDASGFRQAPPHKVWDRTQGHKSRGSLRLMGEAPGELVWTAEPPTQIPGSTTLNIRAMVKTHGVAGQGVFIRVRYHTFVWHPHPHVEWVQDLVSKPVAGTTGWVKIEVPPLTVPEEHFDYLVQLDVVLDGQGVAWVTDVEIDLQPTAPAPPAAALDLPVREPALAG